MRGHGFGATILGMLALKKRRALWVGFLLVLVPLIILLGLQYRWLGAMEDVTGIVRQAALNNYLDNLSQQVEVFYTGNAEQALDLPTSHVIGERQKLLKYLIKRSSFKSEKVTEPGRTVPKKPITGVQLIFVRNFEDPHDETPFMFDPQTRSEPENIPDNLAVKVQLTCYFWQMRARQMRTKKNFTVSEGFIVEEDPEYPMIINPILDEQNVLVGMSGMVLDLDFFKHTFLPDLICTTLPKVTSHNDLSLTVRDDRKNVVLVEGIEAPPGESEEMVKTLAPFFPHWEFGLQDRGKTFDQWARTNFLFNMSLSLVLGLFLMGGIVMALRIASREMKLSEMKNDFVSNVSHELRTPLASIRAFGELLRLGRFKDEAKVREYGEFIDTEGRRLSQLINNILDFSKIESGQKTYRFEPTDLLQVVHHTLRTYEVRARHDHIEIEYQDPDQPLPQISVDGNAITQAFGNLIDNAIKYNNGGDRIFVSIQQQNDSVVFTVSDQGMGIAREEQEKIFDRFHRVGTGLVHDVKGSGLGLSIVQHIIKAHRGTVTVESEPGSGSRFSIHLPIDNPEQETVTRAAPSTETQET